MLQIAEYFQCTVALQISLTEHVGILNMGRTASKVDHFFKFRDQTCKVNLNSATSKYFVLDIYTCKNFYYRTDRQTFQLNSNIR